MRHETRKLFNQIMAATAQHYGVESMRETFAATPTQAQSLMDKVVEESAFLQRINVIGVTEQVGEKILGSDSGLVGKRTDTSTKDRKTSDVLSLDPYGYECKFTEFDVHMKYSTVDAWGKFPDLADRYARYVRRAIAHARIKTGFYGKTAATETDPVTNPMGEDVNVGWLQKLRLYDGGSKWLKEGNTPGEIRLGPGGDYPNLDALVHDVKNGIGEAHREAGDIAAMMGRDLLSWDKGQLYKAQGSTPTEKERIEVNAVTRTYGGLPSFYVPFFPARGLLTTSWDNLSLYFQDTAVRRHIMDNPKRNRVEDYNSSNDAYVVEDYEKAAGIEFVNVLLWDDVTETWV